MLLITSLFSNGRFVILRHRGTLSGQFNDSLYVFCPGSTLEVPLVYEGLGCTALGHRVKVKTVQTVNHRKLEPKVLNS